MRRSGSNRSILRLARETHLEALHAAAVAGRLGMGMRDAATAARTAPAAPGPQRASDVLLDGLAVRFTDGIRAGAPILKLALAALLDGNGDYEEDMRWPWLACRVAADVFDDETWHLLASRYVLIARGAGALGVLADRPHAPLADARVRREAGRSGGAGRGDRFDHRRDRQPPDQRSEADARRVSG